MKRHLPLIRQIVIGLAIGQAGRESGLFVAILLFAGYVGINESWNKICRLSDEVNALSCLTQINIAMKAKQMGQNPPKTGVIFMKGSDLFEESGRN